MNRNIPILIILSLFVATNAILYNYLNNGYFVDKKPSTDVKNIEKVIFKLIKYNEDAILQQKLENERRIEALRNKQLGELDQAAKAKIQAELDRLEQERRELEQAEINSKNEALEARKRVEDSQLEISELKDKASSLGAQYDGLQAEFDEYVTTLEDAVLENSDSENEINRVKSAFNQRRGLDFLESLVGNTQKERSELTNFYLNKLKSKSETYKDGLKEIANYINNKDYIPVNDNEGLIESSKSINDLRNRLNRFLKNRDDNNNKKLLESLSSQEDELNKRHIEDLNKQINDVLTLEETKKEEALTAQELEHQAELERLREELSTLSEEDVQKLLDEIEEKDILLAELQQKLEEEIQKEKSTPKVPTADKPIYTDWIHIPGLWSSRKTSLEYSGKKIDSIAWSRAKITDNTTISFYGDFEKGGENIIILYGNGRFKSWKDGVIISIQDMGGNRALLTITENGISNNATTLYTDSIEARNGISGSYFIEVSQGKLSLMLGGSIVLDKLPIDIKENRVIGFGNREEVSKSYKINNLKIFKIK